MKDKNFLNLFWIIVWGLVCLFAVVGIWWNPAQVFSAIISAGMCVMFICDYSRVKRMK